MNYNCTLQYCSLQLLPRSYKVDYDLLCYFGPGTEENGEIIDVDNQSGSLFGEGKEEKKKNTFAYVTWILIPPRHLEDCITF